MLTQHLLQLHELLFRCLVRLPLQAALQKEIENSKSQKNADPFALATDSELSAAWRRSVVDKAQAADVVRQRTPAEEAAYIQRLNK